LVYGREHTLPDRRDRPAGPSPAPLRRLPALDPRRRRAGAGRGRGRERRARRRAARPQWLRRRHRHRLGGDGHRRPPVERAQRGMAARGGGSRDVAVRHLLRAPAAGARAGRQGRAEPGRTADGHGADLAAAGRGRGSAVRGRAGRLPGAGHPPAGGARTARGRDRAGHVRARRQPRLPLGRCDLGRAVPPRVQHRAHARLPARAQRRAGRRGPGPTGVDPRGVRGTARARHPARLRARSATTRLHRLGLAHPPAGDPLGSRQMQTRSMGPGAGWRWLARAVDLGRHDPKALCGGAALLMLVALLPSVVQQLVLLAVGPDNVQVVLAVSVVTTLAMILVFPLLIAGYLRVIDAAENRRPTRATAIFDTFRAGSGRGRIIGTGLLLMLVYVAL